MGADLGALLTFEAANTGLARSFQIETQQAGAVFVFDDGISSFFDNALSIGAINQHENDDWSLTVLGNLPITAIGFEIRNNASSSGESIKLLDNAGNVLDTIALDSVSQTNGFIGVIADFAFSKIAFAFGQVLWASFKSPRAKCVFKIDKSSTSLPSLNSAR